MNLNRKCFFCGTRYHYCPSCPDDELKPVWHVLFCKETCKQMDKILSDHTFKKITDAEAYAALSALTYDLHKIDNPDNVRHIKEILASHKTKKTPQKTPDATASEKQ